MRFPINRVQLIKGIYKAERMAVSFKTREQYMALLRYVLLLIANLKSGIMTYEKGILLCIRIAIILAAAETRLESITCTPS